MRQKIRQNPFARGPKNLLFVVFFFVICLGLLTKLTDYTRHVKSMSYSAFMEAVEQDKVKAVHVSGQDVYGVMKDGSRFEAIIAENGQNWDFLRKHNVEFSVAASANQMSMWYMILLFALLIIPLAIWYFLRQARGGGSGSTSNIFTMGKSRARIFMPASIKENFDSVAGAQESKQALYDIIDYLRNPEKYRRLGAKVPKGVLLVGEPGNGKTLLAKAAAGEANCPFFSISGSELIEVFVGVGAARVRDLFAQARKHAPSIVFIDEIDAIGRQRGNGFGGGHDEREQTLNQLLTEMDGFETTHPSIIVIAATNMPDVLDRALLRPGRFDRLIEVPYPDADSREQILKIHAKKVKLDPSVDFKYLARETAGFSGADLADLVNKAAIIASKNNKDVVTFVDLCDAHKMMLHANSSSNSTPMASTARTATKTTKMFMPSQVKVKFADVAGIPEAKEELQDVVDFLRNPEKFKRLGAKLTRGVLLVGEPGNGKTLLAKAIAGESNCPFFSTSASDFVEVFVGVGASRIRDLFVQARKHMPSIVFIDEIDAVGGHRMTGHGGGSDERAQTLNQLLTEMDGFNTGDSAVIVIAATNRPDVLDSALVRSGRFDKRIDIPYPTLASREQILRVHTKSIKIDTGVDLHQLARATPGFSGADLALLANEAAVIATKKNKDFVELVDFDEARDKIMLGKELRSVILTPEERKMVAYHESGHALVRLLSPKHADPLHKITIIPRRSALGLTHFLPETEKYLRTKDEMIGSIMTSLGGRIAEQQVFGVLSSGAYSDFVNATEIARKMVCLYGMTDELGPVVYDKERDRFEYSQKTAEKIDEVVHNILKEAQTKTEKLLEENRDKLELLSQTLLEKETMYAHEVYQLLGIEPRADFRLIKEEPKGNSNAGNDGTA